MNSKMTYVVAGSVFGGTLGYLLLTDSGRKTMRSIRNFDMSTIPDKVEEIHDVIERRSLEFNRRVQAARERITNSIDEGKRAYQDAGDGYLAQAQRVETRHNEIAANLHRSVDELNRTVTTVEKSVLSGMFHVGSLVRAIQSGLKRLTSGEASEPRLTSVR